MFRNFLKKITSGLFTAVALISISVAVSAEASASTATTAGNKSSIYTLVLLGAMLVLMYFLMIRPQKKKEKEVKEMREALKPGDKIVTIGGIVGKVCTVKDDTVTIETGADKIRIKFLKTAIANVERGKSAAEHKEAKSSSDESKTE